MIEATQPAGGGVRSMESSKRGFMGRNAATSRRWRRFVVEYPTLAAAAHLSTVIQMHP